MEQFKRVFCYISESNLTLCVSCIVFNYVNKTNNMHSLYIYIKSEYCWFCLHNSESVKNVTKPDGAKYSHYKSFTINDCLILRLLSSYEANRY